MDPEHPSVTEIALHIEAGEDWSDLIPKDSLDAGLEAIIANSQPDVETLVVARARTREMDPAMLEALLSESRA